MFEVGKTLTYYQNNKARLKGKTSTGIIEYVCGNGRVAVKPTHKPYIDFINPAKPHIYLP